MDKIIRVASNSLEVCFAARDANANYHPTNPNADFDKIGPELFEKKKEKEKEIAIHVSTPNGHERKLITVIPMSLSIKIPDVSNNFVTKNYNHPTIHQNNLLHQRLSVWPSEYQY